MLEISKCEIVPSPIIAGLIVYIQFDMWYKNNPVGRYVDLMHVNPFVKGKKTLCVAGRYFGIYQNQKSHQCRAVIHHTNVRANKLLDAYRKSILMQTDKSSFVLVNQLIQQESQVIKYIQFAQMGLPKNTNNYISACLHVCYIVEDVCKDTCIDVRVHEISQGTPLVMAVILTLFFQLYFPFLSQELVLTIILFIFKYLYSFWFLILLKIYTTTMIMVMEVN